MPTPFTFAPEQIAYYEKAGWEAYYNRNWLRAFWLLVQLNRAQFRMARLTALAAALDIVRASVAFAPAANDVAKATHFIEHFFAKARHTLHIKTDAHTLAQLEIDYWLVHRQLAISRQQNQQDDDLEPMIQALAKLHAALFDAPVETMRASAEWRALAAKTVDQITGHYSTDVTGDWQQVEVYLRKAYQSVPVP